MHPPHVKQAAMELLATGLNDCEVSRHTGIPRATIRDWRRPTYVRRASFEHEVCPRCWRRTKPVRLTPGDYAELLAMYLGDGSIAKHPRTHRLRIVLDKKYPGIIRDARALLERCFPYNRVDEVSAPGCVHVSLYSSHLTCLFPQHGSGPKHQRRLILEPWQEHHLRDEAWRFIRGCIRTDGCVFINRTNVHRPRPYEYLSYAFSNKSRDIVDLFIGACFRVGVFTRATCNPAGQWHVRINRRASVALMLEHVGRKD